MNTKREPALTAGAFGTAVVAVLLAYRIINAEQALAWSTLLTMVLTALVPFAQALYTRRKVMPVDTVKAAGLDPEAVNRAADNPAVQPFVEP
jgi:VIT1/CCC1 family predicted Fe2+/Mn2+ transporter